MNVVKVLSRLGLKPDSFPVGSKGQMKQIGMGESTIVNLCVSRYASNPTERSVRNYWSNITFLITKN